MNQLFLDKSVSRKYCMYYNEFDMEDYQAFLEYHKRMESFLLFFVDGASRISADDEQWCFYTL